MESRDYRLAVVIALDYPGMPAHSPTDPALPSREFETLSRILSDRARASGGMLADRAGLPFVLSFANVRNAFSFISGILTDASGSQAVARAGMHAGDVSVDGGRISGEAVETALALRSLAAPGKLVVSNQTAALAPGVLKSEDGRRLPPSTHLPAGIDAMEYSFGTGGTAGPDSVRQAILEAVRERGRRLTVDEAIAEFGSGGPEAMEAIARLSEAGILIGRRRNADLGSSIESAIHAIVSDIERAVDRIPERDARSSGSRGGFNITIDSDTFRQSAAQWRQVGQEFKRHIRDNVRESASGRREHRPQREVRVRNRDSFEAYENELAKKADKSGRSIAGSIVGFAIANAALWYVNLAIAPGLVWAPIVTFFTGFGIIESIVKASRSRSLAREISALPELGDEETKELKAINKERESIVSHALSAISVPAGLAIINSIVSPGQSWFVIPSLIMAGTFVLHLAGYLSTMPGRMRKFLERLGIEGGMRGLRQHPSGRGGARSRENPADLGVYTELYSEASSTAEEILSSMRTMDPKAAQEMKPQLDGYLDQVLLLTRTANELDTIIGDIPMEELRKDKEGLLRKREMATGELKSTYDTGIAEIQAQEDSLVGLEQQREIIDMRIKSSVNQLAQMKMDLARARATDAQTTALGSESALNALKQRSVELSRYIDDLREGHLEAKKDPFEELEEKFSGT